MMDLTHYLLLSAIVLVLILLPATFFLFFANKALKERKHHLYCRVEELKEELKKAKETPSPIPTVEAKELLGMLLNDHRAILRLHVVDPGDFFLRAPGLR